jgi:transposase
MPPRCVKPYVKRNKNDAADAAAICEAVTRPTMRFVAVKSAGQQSVLMLHRTREIMVRQRTMLVNAIRAHMAELGLVPATACMPALGLDASGQQEHDHDNQGDADQPARAVAPTAAIAPGREGTDQDQDEDDYQDCSD